MLSWEKKIDILLSRLIAQLKRPQDLRDHKLTLVGDLCGDLSQQSTARTQSQISPPQTGQGFGAALSADRAAQIAAPGHSSDGAMRARKVD